MIPRSIEELGPPPAIGLALHSVPNGAPADRRCPGCCHWSLPLSFTATKSAFGVVITMEYESWLLWHAHVVLHQRTELVS